MFAFSSPLFWYKLLFMFELLIAESLFTYRLRKKSNIFLRVPCAVICCFLAAFFYPMFNYDAFYSSAMFLVLFAVTLPMLKLCFDEPWKNLLFCAIAAYTVKHFAFIVESLLLDAFGVSETGALSYYGDQISVMPSSQWAIATYCGAYSVVYWLAYVLFGSKINKKASLRIDSFRLTVLSGGIILINIVLNAIIMYYGLLNYDIVYVTIIYVYNALCCVFVMFLQFGFLNRQELKTELNIMRQLRAQEQEQHRITQENIDLINMKCHDIKHFIRKKGEARALDEEAIREMEEAINIYDLSAKTGNETLDILLTEKSLFCQKNNIKITCVADGKALDFMSNADIYSLFGNAIGNAVESVSKITDKEKRIIGIVIKSTNKLLSVHIENYFVGKLSFLNGLPETTHRNKLYHGYGLKSIKYIVEKYDGNMTVFAENEVFNLNILFPITL